MIKFATAETLPSISQLIVDWGNDMGFNVDKDDVHKDMEYMLEKGRIIYVEHEGKIMGLMCGNIVYHYWLKEKAAHEHFFFVRKECRNSGLGKILVNTFCEWAKLMGCNSVIIYPNHFGSVAPEKIKDSLIKMGFSLHGYSVRKVLDV